MVGIDTGRWLHPRVSQARPLKPPDDLYSRLGKDPLFSMIFTL